MYKYLSILLLALCATACSHDSEEVEPAPEPAAGEYYKVPVEIRIAASEVQKRLPGDPGEDPRPPLPDYLYIFAVVTNGQDESTILCNTYAGIEDKWGQPVGSVYTYDETVSLPGLDGVNKAKLYIVTSRKPLKFYPEYPQTKGDVENLILRKTDNPDTENMLLRDIYYDVTAEFEFDWAKDYTGAAPGESITVTAMCTHLCAKVDFLWNLSDVFRANNPAWRVKSVSVTGMPDATYVFNPLTPIAGVKYETATAFSTDKGNNIYGRTDFYHFQRPDNGSIGWQFEFQEEATAEGGSAEAKFASGVFTPANKPGSIAYYRLFFTVNGLTSPEIETVSEEPATGN